LQIVTACFHQGGLGHTARTSERHVLKSLHKCFYRLSLLLLRFQESRHGNIQVIFEEQCKEELLQVTSVFDEAFREFHEPFKGKPFQSADEQTCQDGIIIYYIPCNTLLSEYVLSCVFRLFDRIFLFDLLSVFVLYYELFICSFCLGSGFVDSESALI